MSELMGLSIGLQLSITLFFSELSTSVTFIKLTSFSLAQVSSIIKKMSWYHKIFNPQNPSYLFLKSSDIIFPLPNNKQVVDVIKNNYVWLRNKQGALRSSFILRSFELAVQELTPGPSRVLESIQTLIQLHDRVVAFCQSVNRFRQLDIHMALQTSVTKCVVEVYMTRLPDPLQSLAHYHFGYCEINHRGYALIVKIFHFISAYDWSGFILYYISLFIPTRSQHEFRVQDDLLWWSVG